MDPPAAPASTAWPLPCPHQDWAQTPPAVHASRRAGQHDLAHLRALQSRGEVLEARCKPDATTSHRPPASDHPYTKPPRRSPSAPPRPAGGTPGPGGHRQGLWPPTAVPARHPERGAGGPTTCGMTTPDQTHQVSERPHSAMAVTHWVWSQGCCRGCGTWSTAPRPPRAGHRRWAALQGPERCTGRDLWQRATDGPDLVGLGAAGAPACGSQPAGTRPGAAGDRPALGRDGAARPPGSGPLPGCNRVVAPQHAARAVGDGP